MYLFCIIFLGTLVSIIFCISLSKNLQQISCYMFILFDRV